MSINISIQFIKILHSTTFVLFNTSMKIFSKINLFHRLLFTMKILTLSEWNIHAGNAIYSLTSIPNLEELDFTLSIRINPKTSKCMDPITPLTLIYDSVTFTIMCKCMYRKSSRNITCNTALTDKVIYYLKQIMFKKFSQV